MGLRNNNGKILKTGGGCEPIMGEIVPGYNTSNKDSKDYDRK